MSSKVIIIVSILLLTACNRSGLLDSITSTNVETITSAEDVEHLLNNKFLYDWESNISVLITDEISYNPSIYPQLNTRDISFYYWRDNFIQENESFEDWKHYYNKILTVNAIIDFYSLKQTLSKYDKFLLGISYFIRAKTYYDLMQLHSYANINSESMLGVPLRITAYIDETIQQLSIRATFAFIDSDLQKALNLTKEAEKTTSINILVNRKWILAFASRYFLYTQQYEKSLFYSKELLGIEGGSLINFTLYTNQNTRIFLQPDIIGTISFNSLESVLLSMMTNTNIYINEELIGLYNNYDKRKSLFFTLRNGKYFYKNPYLASLFSSFMGFTYSEVFLNKLECELRLNYAQDYQASLAEWLSKRYTQNIFTSAYTNSLDFIRDERKKEFIMRGIRLADIKRYYNEGTDTQLKKILDQNEVKITVSDPGINILYPNSVIKSFNIRQVARN
ncbi:RagB/SusD family nutrient uptake outer membrane protein [Gynurincola endophyticus]|uniref:RagB/SusD family nutrient uptake outer membrane protein n=1 Tax=Gynurincola endophyticus TaxID=2479004 RepID=UPI000F8EBCB2|nr:RagB/SusD family nutrient uptake outer membrane protein [Gynurincola endophyticus]